jgi:hypothetical protein
MIEVQVMKVGNTYYGQRGILQRYTTGGRAMVPAVKGEVVKSGGTYGARNCRQADTIISDQQGYLLCWLRLLYVVTPFCAGCRPGEISSGLLLYQMTSQQLWHWELLHPDAEVTVRGE